MTTESTALAPRLEDALAGFDFSELAKDGYQSPFGTFGWMHGNKAAKQAGAFYGKETEFANAPQAPWKLDDRFADGKNPENGYSAVMIKLAFIGTRSQWFTEDQQADGRKRRHWLKTYVPDVGAKKQVEWLVLAEGVDLPMILAGSKMTKTKPFDDIILTYKRTLLKQASLRMKNPMPLFSYWLPISGEVDAAGKPVYSEVSGKDGKSSFVTYPKLYLPKNAIDTNVLDLDTLRYAQSIRREYLWWFEEQREQDDTVTAEYEIEDAPLQIEAPRNAPKPIESDEDLPF